MWAFSFEELYSGAFRAVPDATKTEELPHGNPCNRDEQSSSDAWWARRLRCGRRYSRRICDPLLPAIGREAKLALAGRARVALSLHAAQGKKITRRPRERRGFAERKIRIGAGCSFLGHLRK